MERFRLISTLGLSVLLLALSGLSCEDENGTVPRPPAPENLTAEVEGSSVRLRWNPTEPDNYRLERSDFVYGSFREVAVIEGDTEEYLDNDVIYGETYFYRVRAYDDDYDNPFSDYSNEVEINVS